MRRRVRDSNKRTLPNRTRHDNTLPQLKNSGPAEDAIASSSPVFLSVRPKQRKYSSVGD